MFNTSSIVFPRTVTSRITTQLYFMPDVDVTCAACTGARFNPEARPESVP